MNTRYYRSKIGRLPFVIRNELNERIRDGETSGKLVDWLNGRKEYKSVMRTEKCGAISAQNLTDWRGTGYKDWLDDQAHSERIRKLAEQSMQIVTASGGSVATVGANIVAGQLLDILERVPDEKVGDLVNAITRLQAQETSARRLDLAKNKVAISREALELEKMKFQRVTCELFVKWSASQDAQQIAGDRTLDNDAKTEALGKLMFGDLWKSQ